MSAPTLMRLGHLWLLIATATIACSHSQQGDIFFASASGPFTDPAVTIDVFAMRPDGSSLRQLTQGPNDRRANNFPTVSPDGSRIAFLVLPRSSNARNELHLMNADGSNDRLLLRLDSLDVVYPDWSPDGRRIAVTGQETPDQNGDARSWLFVVREDGTDVTRVTREPMVSLCAGWLPAGDAVLVSEGSSLGPASIKRIAVPSGESQILMKSDTITPLCPMPSPDGSKVLFTGIVLAKDPKTNGPKVMQMDVWQMNSDGSNPRPFVTLGGFSKNPRWSRDAQRVVLHGSRSAMYFDLPESASGNTIEIFATDSDGRRIVQVTRNTIPDIHPSW